jgi:chromosome segregation ATPase
LTEREAEVKLLKEQILQKQNLLNSLEERWSKQSIDFTSRQRAVEMELEEVSFYFNV